MSNLVQLHIDRDTGDFVARNAPVQTSTASGFVHEEITPITTWTIVHNQNSEQLICQIYDTTGELILPDKVSIINLNTVEVEFGAPQDGKAHLMFFIV